MIIYASVGLGKTTYCETHKSCFDADYYKYKQSNYNSYSDYVQAMHKHYKVVFINHIEGIDLNKIDQVYLAESFNMVVDRVTKRLTNSVIPSIDVFRLEREIFPNAILLKPNQYLSDVFKEI